MTPGAKHFWNFPARWGGTGFSGLRTMSGRSRYDAVAARLPSFSFFFFFLSLPKRPAQKKTKRTDRTPLCMLLTDALDSMEFHIDRLSGTQFGEDDVRVRRRRRGVVPREHILLLALRLPLEVGRQHLVVVVQLIRIRFRRGPRRIRLARARDLQFKHDRVLVRRRFVGSVCGSHVCVCIGQWGPPRPVAVESTPFRAMSNAGSTLSGTRPRRCANTSSTTIEVLFHTYTFSIAIVGIYAASICQSCGHPTNEPDGGGHLRDEYPPQGVRDRRIDPNQVEFNRALRQSLHFHLQILHAPCANWSVPHDRRVDPKRTRLKRAKSHAWTWSW